MLPGLNNKISLQMERPFGGVLHDYSLRIDVFRRIIKFSVNLMFFSRIGATLESYNWYRLLYILIRVTSNILCCNEKKLIHAFHHCAIIENLSLKSLSKPHDMVQIDGHIALLCKFQDVLSAIIAAGRGIKDHIGTVFDQ